MPTVESRAARLKISSTFSRGARTLSSRLARPRRHRREASRRRHDKNSEDASARAGGAYGECANLDDRMASPWWARHSASFAARQRDAYERSGSLGWAFGAWKFDEATEQSMHPAVLAQRSLRAASQAGWLPDLSAKPALPPCLRAPAADFALGDDTAPPSAAPPPPPPPQEDWPVEAAAPSGRVAAALGGFGCGALLAAMVVMASRKRGAATGYEAV